MGDQSNSSGAALTEDGAIILGDYSSASPEPDSVSSDTAAADTTGSPVSESAPESASPSDPDIFHLPDETTGASVTISGPDATNTPETPPRPPSIDDLQEMMADAEQRAEEKAAEKKAAKVERMAPISDPVSGGQPVSGAAGSLFRVGAAKAFSQGLLWGGLVVACVSAVYVMAYSQERIWVVLLGLLAVIAAGAILAGALGLFSRRDPRVVGVGLAKVDHLTNLGVTEKVLDSDPDPRLVTKRDGVVVYANAAYFQLASDAGVMGGVGLPPRIDRLFSQQGPESAKVFRLARAAKSGGNAEEVIHQVIGLEDGGRRRRYAVAVAPVQDTYDYVVWRLRELPIEEEQDVLSASFADFVRPIMAVEKSGQIAWTNAALRETLGLARGGVRHIDDIVLGESDGLLSHLWKLDQEPFEAQVRRRDREKDGAAGPALGVFRAFRRGGVGEGFACVELTLDEAPKEDKAPSVSGDLTEAPFGVAIVEGEFGRDAKIIEANKAFADAFNGAAKRAALSRCMPDKTIEEIAAEIRGRGANAAPRIIDATISPTDGASRTFGVYARPVKRRRGSYGVRRTFLYTVDVTDRKRMEEDYAQDQKLKAIGNIAGEVAHDFNNLLQVVLISCEELLSRHPAGDPSYSDLLLIRQNAQRAANLTRQLLAYSRKQTLTTKVEGITDLLLDFSRFLDRAVGEKVKLELVNGRDLPAVKVDRLQLETAIMNLAVNARDAMAPAGGKVTIRTQRLTAADLEEKPVQGLATQDHLLIEVADTGGGVPTDIMQKIFDPFFTTKAEGKGTGLGLSTVHGVIGQMGGAITIENREGADGVIEGAVFRIYLPAYVEEATNTDAPAPEGKAPVKAPEKKNYAKDDYSGTGRILVVEDEDGVRLSVLRTVERAGYEVVVADDGVEALEIIEEDKNFDLVISDVMMPEVDGPTFVRRAHDEYGLNLPVIFMSGYAESAVRDQLGELTDALYIQKPFSRAELGAIVREALHGEEAA